MRTRAIVVILTWGLAAGAAAGGCQFIAQLNELQVTSTGGSSTGGSTTSTSSGTTSHTTSAGTGGSATSSSGATTSSSGATTGTGGTCPAPTSSTGSSGGPTCGLDAGTCEAGMPGMGCPMCSGNVCTLECMPSMCPSSPNSVITMMGAAAVVCDTAHACDGKVFNCSGPHLCEIDCSVQDACDGVTINCDPSGPCRVSCAGKACNNVTINCGNDACDATYFQPSGCMLPPVTQKCNGSCNCTHEAH